MAARDRRVEDGPAVGAGDRRNGAAVHGVTVTAPETPQEQRSTQRPHGHPDVRGEASGKPGRAPAGPRGTRYAVRRANGTLWRYQGKVATFRTMNEAQCWLINKRERVVVYKPRKKVRKCS